MLKNAPMFKRQGAKAASSGTASGRGKSAILRAQGTYKTIVTINITLCLPEIMCKRNIIVNNSNIDI